MEISLTHINYCPERHTLTVTVTLMWRNNMHKRKFHNRGLPACLPALNPKSYPLCYPMVISMWWIIAWLSHRWRVMDQEFPHDLRSARHHNCCHPVLLPLLIYSKEVCSKWKGLVERWGRQDRSARDLRADWAFDAESCSVIISKASVRVDIFTLTFQAPSRWPLSTRGELQRIGLQVSEVQ